MVRLLFMAAAACTLLTSHDSAVQQMKDVEIVAVKRACCGSGLIEFLHTVSVRTPDGKKLDLYAVSGAPKKDPLPNVGEYCDFRYEIRCTELFGDNRPVIRDFKCGPDRGSP